MSSVPASRANARRGAEDEEGARPELQALGQTAIAQEINVESTQYGPTAERGIRKLQEAKRLQVDGTVGKDTWAALGVHEPVVGIPQKNPTRAMAAATTDFSTKEATIAAIKSACGSQGIGLKAQIAYVLATVDHETAHTFKPVKEAYWLDDPDAYLKAHHPDYYPYYGRGYVQLTWKNNYDKYGKLVGKDLVGSPTSSLHPQVALFVLATDSRPARSPVTSSPTTSTPRRWTS